MTTKVSVIVAAFQPGSGLDRVVQSLALQTLPADEFEVIIVDDGSPDDTYARLVALRDAYQNIRISRIENSGWASLPRNVGLGMALGEYVLFMDHDDYLYPRALERSYEYGALHGADVVSVKESKTTDVGWGIDNFTENIPNARERLGIASLLPMMPHKLYRRAFLNEHSIRFPVGRRMLWEDVYFNVEAYRHARVISVLADTPVYRWTHTGSNTSTTYGPDSQEFWTRLTELFEFIQATLPGADFQEARETVIVQQYRTRLLGRFDGQLAEAGDEWVPMALKNITRILADHVPETLDGRLGKAIQPRAYLLRAGRIDLMRQLRALDSVTLGVTRSDGPRWHEGRLVIDAETRWHVAGGRPLPLRRQAGRILRVLPPAVEAALPPELIDVTEAIDQAKTTITITSRHEHVTWALPTENVVQIDSRDGEAESVFVEARAVVDLEHAALGNPLHDAIWDFHARNSLIGMTNHRALKTGTVLGAAMVDGVCAVQYANVNGQLSLDLGQMLRSIVTGGYTASEPVVFPVRDDGTIAFVLPLDGVDIVGRTRVVGEIELHTQVGRISRRAAAMLTRRLRIPWTAPQDLGATRATLIADEQGARLEGTVRARPGSYRLVCRFGGHTAVTPVRVRIARGKGATFFRASPGSI